MSVALTHFSSEACGMPFPWMGNITGVVAPPTLRSCRVPRKPGPIPSLGTTGDVRRSMIERAEVMRARLAARLARDDLGARSRRTAFRQLRQIEERLVDLRDGE